MFSSKPKYFIYINSKVFILKKKNYTMYLYKKLEDSYFGKKKIPLQHFYLYEGPRDSYFKK